MITVIVPTDFSETADNAAVYAEKMLTGHYDARLILYHVYDNKEEAAAAVQQLQVLKEKLMHLGYVKIETRHEENSDFISSLERLARYMDAQLIIMGITGKSKLEQVLFGSNTLKMVERNVCPVLIVPPAATFRQIKNVALASDFKDVKTTIPIIPIKNILKLFTPALHVVNVNSDHYVSLTEEFIEQRRNMLTLFEEYQPEFYFIGTFDVEDTINIFVGDKNIDLLVTVPRQRNPITSLFKSSTTKKLVFETTIPILAAHA